MSGSAAAAIGAAAVLLVAVAVLWASGGGRIDLPWAPAWDLRLAFGVDGLAALYWYLAAGVGVLVFTYASAYVPRHLAHDERPRAEEWRVHAAMTLFLVSMVGLVTSEDLILLFVFWDLTAIASWLLIGFDRQKREARLFALMALLITTVSAVLMLIGILMLRAEYGTTQLPELFRLAEPGTTVAVAAGFIAVSALAKSAQVPLHFWLPRAMAAPTPVSAYLHSAAMVAAGVFLISRIHPLLALEPALLDALLVIGLASMALGGVLSLAADEFKRLLAFSTVSQYGYVTAMLGVGGSAGAAAACFYVLAHALAKSALFMTAGAVTEATGTKLLSESGGLARRMPLLAAGAGAAAAGIAALPLTIGFFKDELFFKAAAERGTWLAILAVLGAGLTFAYMARFWAGIFLGAPKGDVQHVERRLVWPVAFLGALVVVGGVVVAPFADLARSAADVTNGGPVDLKVAYHLDTRTENLMALGAWATGLLLFAGHAVITPALRWVERAGDAMGPERLYWGGLRLLNDLSDRAHDFEIRDLRSRVAAVIVPGGGLVALGVVLTPTAGAYAVGSFETEDIALGVTLVVCAIAAIAVTFPRGHLALALMLSGVGFALATAYALIGASDVALVAVLIETIFALLFVGVYALVPQQVLRREARRVEGRSRMVRDLVIAVASGIVTTLVVWSALSRPIPVDGMAERHIELADDAHGQDVVTVILADFRGLDTLVEITVVGVAMIIVAAAVRTRTRA
ncbi:MAG: oxidoreductase [Solirubrobacteraceae bacterium]|nr:oxidoreductase [Solirubrobacteraceae bacterium]